MNKTKIKEIKWNNIFIKWFVISIVISYAIKSVTYWLVGDYSYFRIIIDLLISTITVKMVWSHSKVIQLLIDECLNK